MYRYPDNLIYYFSEVTDKYICISEGGKLFDKEGGGRHNIYIYLFEGGRACPTTLRQWEYRYWIVGISWVVYSIS